MYTIEIGDCHISGLFLLGGDPVSQHTIVFIISLLFLISWKNPCEVASLSPVHR